MASGGFTAAVTRTVLVIPYLAITIACTAVAVFATRIPSGGSPLNIEGDCQIRQRRIRAFTSRGRPDEPARLPGYRSARLDALYYKA